MMTIKQYLNEVQKLAKKYPNARVVYVRDTYNGSVVEHAYPPIEGTVTKGEFVASIEDDAKVSVICLN